MKRIISLILTAVMLISAASFAFAESKTPFTDVKSGAWYESAVAEVYEKGIMEGKGEGKFAPKASMTRAELVTVLCRLSGDNSAGKGTALTFSDTKKNAWYSDSVAWAVEAGIVAGYEGNTFKPNRPVLRQELAKMFVEFMEYMDLPMEGTPLTDSFRDNLSFKKWASGYIETLRKTGLMGGDTAGNFNPRAEASRAEIATVITRLLPKLERDSVDIFTNGKSDFTIVYDDSNVELTRCMIALVQRLNIDHRSNIKAVRASSAEADYGREIIVGAAREAGRVLGESLGDDDFAIQFAGNDIVLAASDPELYIYVLKVFETEVLAKVKDRNLSIDSSFSFRYSESSLNGKTYEQYLADLMRSGTDIYAREIQHIFTKERYEPLKLDYRLHVPAYYDESKEYPVLLFLHGAGERGNDNSKQITVMINSMFNQDNALLTETIVIAPQCSDELGWWRPDYLKLLLDRVCSEYSVDRDRIYVMGYSMGGFGSFDLITTYTDTFAAAVPMCAGASASDAQILRDFPLYVVHGAKDDTCPVSGSRAIVNALKQLGSKSVIYEELPDFGHNVWGYTANKSEILEWLFEQRKSNR